MQCPYCANDSQVVDSRVTADGVRRRRLCNECRRRFTTYERVGAPNIKVIKRNSKSESFDPEKLVRVLSKVCRDRPNIAKGDIQRLARGIEAQLIDDRAKTVTSGILAERLLGRLRDLDILAYSRLAANYIDEDGQLRTESKAGPEKSASQLGLFKPDDESK